MAPPSVSFALPLLAPAGAGGGGGPGRSPPRPRSPWPSSNPGQLEAIADEDDDDEEEEEEARPVPPRPSAPVPLSSSPAVAATHPPSSPVVFLPRVRRHQNLPALVSAAPARFVVGSGRPPPSLASLRELRPDRDPLYGHSLRPNRLGSGAFFARTQRFEHWRAEASESVGLRDDFWHRFMLRREVGEEEPALMRQETPLPAPAVEEDDDSASVLSVRVPARARTPTTTTVGNSLFRRVTTRLPSRLSLRAPSRAISTRLRAVSQMRGDAFRAVSRASLGRPTTIRLAVVGEPCVGKTALITRLTTGKYQESAGPSQQYSASEYHVAVDGREYIVEAWDIPGKLDDDGNPHPLMSAFFHGAIICIDLEGKNKTDLTMDLPASLTKLRSCLVEGPVFVLGCKKDARPTFPKLRLMFEREAHPISHDAGERASRQICAAKYMECSALTGEGVTEAFESVVRHVSAARDENERNRSAAGRLRRRIGLGSRRISQFFTGRRNNNNTEADAGADLRSIRSRDEFGNPTPGFRNPPPAALLNYPIYDLVDNPPVAGPSRTARLSGAAAHQRNAALLAGPPRTASFSNLVTHRHGADSVAGPSGAAACQYHISPVAGLYEAAGLSRAATHYRGDDPLAGPSGAAGPSNAIPYQRHANLSAARPSLAGYHAPYLAGPSHHALHTGAESPRAETPQGESNAAVHRRDADLPDTGPFRTGYYEPYPAGPSRQVTAMDTETPQAENPDRELSDAVHHRTADLIDTGSSRIGILEAYPAGEPSRAPFPLAEPPQAGTPPGEFSYTLQTDYVNFLGVGTGPSRGDHSHASIGRAITTGHPHQGPTDFSGLPRQYDAGLYHSNGGLFDDSRPRARPDIPRIPSPSAPVERHMADDHLPGNHPTRGTPPAGAESGDLKPPSYEPQPAAAAGLGYCGIVPTAGSPGLVAARFGDPSRPYGRPSFDGGNAGRSRTGPSLGVEPDIEEEDE